MAFRDVEGSQIKHREQLEMACHPWKSNTVLCHLLKEAGACSFDTSPGDTGTQESLVSGGLNENGLYKGSYAQLLGGTI